MRNKTIVTKTEKIIKELEELSKKVKHEGYYKALSDALRELYHTRYM